jgi:hypothetical protein
MSSRLACRMSTSGLIEFLRISWCPALVSPFFGETGWVSR